LQKATEIANTIARQIAIYGSGVKNLSGEKKSLSDATNAIIDAEVEKLLVESLDRTRKSMRNNKDKLELLAR
jgi:ATP-dependent Zn protease